MIWFRDFQKLKTQFFHDNSAAIFIIMKYGRSLSFQTFKQFRTQNVSATKTISFWLQNENVSAT